MTSSPAEKNITTTKEISNKKIAKINNQEKTKKPQKTKEKIAKKSNNNLEQKETNKKQINNKQKNETKQTAKKIIIEKKEIKHNKKRDKKISHIKKSRKSHSKFKEFNKLLTAGHIALKEKKYSDALHLYKAAKRFRPRYGKIYKFIGIAYAYMHKTKKACENYKLYLKYDPKAKDKAQVQQYLESCK